METPPEQGPPQTLVRQLPGAFFYPCRNGLVLLIPIVVMSEHASSLLPGVFDKAAALMISLLFGTVLCFFWKELVESSANGSHHFGTQLQLTDWGEQRAYLLKLIGLITVCFTPGALSVSFHARFWVTFGVLAIGGLCFPISFLVMALTDSLAGLHPLFIVRSALRTKRDYGLLVSLFAILVFLPLIEYTGTGDPPTVWQSIAEALSEALTPYGSFVWTRLLGLYYFLNQERLAWS